jgi:molecular chaperone GrpE
LSTDNNSDGIPVNVISEKQTETNEIPVSDKSENSIISEELESSSPNVDEISKLLDLEKQKVVEINEKLKHVLADFQNLNRKTLSDIQNGVNAKVDEFILDFLKIYDDFIRAKEVFSESKINNDGLNSILKNMDSLLKKYQITSIDALGEIFDPNSHDAISIITDPDLDDNTITKEIRKGYISQTRIIRPTLVEISKKDDKK